MIHMTKKLLTFSLFQLCGAFFVFAATPVFYLPLDDSADVLNSKVSKISTGVVHGKSGYCAGVSGKALEVKRHAYDQVTALNFKTPAVDVNEGTVSFWFKPNFKANSDAAMPIIIANGKDFRFYFIKRKGVGAELSVFAPKQLWLGTKDIFFQDRWTHYAFSWSTKTGESRLYVNGKFVGKRNNPAQVEKLAPQELSFWLGEASGDRFKAKVGDGAYDEIKYFDKALSDAEIFALSVAGSDAEMRKFDAEALVSTPESCEFIITDKSPRRASPTKLLELAGDSAKLSLVAMGASGKISFIYSGEREDGIESACILNLTQRHKIVLSKNGAGIDVFVDDSLQGHIPNAVLGKIKSAKIADGVSAYANAGFPSEEEVAALSDCSLRDGEAALWSLGDAQTRRDGAREGVCLNGYWRTIPANEYSYAPQGKNWGYMRVSGSFRSPLYNIYSLKGGKLSSPRQDWDGRNLIGYRAAWYQRAFAVPENLKGGRIYLNFENLNGDYGRVYLNGKLLHSFRQDFKSFTSIPNAKRLDITDIAKPDGNVLTVFIDRAYSGLWQGFPAIGDHQEIAIGDVWLEKAPSKLSITAVAALSSYRQSKVFGYVKIANPDGQKGKVKLGFSFVAENSKKEFSEKFELSGEPEQIVKFSEKWKNPLLWDVENPNLYKMNVVLSADSSVLDTFPSRDFGFREMWVENGGFMLNGKKTRLRMWTSPALNRLRQYFINPASMAQHIAHIKELNYDTVRFDPLERLSQVAWDAYLNECDRAGLYNLFPMPPYNDENMGTYSREVSRFFECYGSRPSIIMWYTDFNTCSYPWNQDPAKLTDYDYNPPYLQAARARTRVADKTMRAIDPTREIFQHAGGNSSEIFTSMNYQSFGTPLREQADWPKQWAQKHTRPLMVVESAFPYSAQYDYFDDRSVGTLGAEHAARYFGDSAFLAEKSPAPHPFYVFGAYSNPDPNMLRLSEMVYRNVVKAWRAYDMSALGDFPEGRDLGRTAVSYDRHNAVFDQIPDPNPKKAGLRFDQPTGGSEAQSHVLGDYTRRVGVNSVVRESFAPLLVFLGGDPEDFTEKTHMYYSGEKFRKSAVIVNDKTSAQKLSFKWTLTLADREVEGGEFAKTVDAGGIEKLPIEITAPQVLKPADARLTLEALSADGVLIREDSFLLRFFPKHVKRKFGNIDIALFDPKGETAPLLDAAGLKYRKVKKFEDLGAARLLIVGRNAIGKKPSELLAKVESEKLIDKGLKILVFEQKASANVGNFVFESPSYRDAFIRLPNSPYVAGLSDSDFSNWRGSAESVPEFVLSDEHSPHYPRSKWKCGNGGIVVGNVIRKPSYGNFTAVVDCGFNLTHAALMEMRRGHGIVLFCQLDVSNRYGSDPAATLLVDNILAEMSTPYMSAGFQRVGYVGDDAGAKQLDRMGMQYTRLTPANIWLANAMQVVILGATEKKQMSDAVVRIVKNNKSIAVVALPNADLGVFASGLKIGKKGVFKATLPENDPVFAGIANADLYFRTARELPVIDAAPDWLRSTSPALFGVLENGFGVNVVFTVAPSDVSGLWNEEKLSRVWNGIFNNMNIGLGKDLRLFSSEKYRHNKLGKKDAPAAWSPYIDNLDFYDGDAFHNW